MRRMNELNIDVPRRGSFGDGSRCDRILVHRDQEDLVRAVERIDEVDSIVRRGKKDRRIRLGYINEEEGSKFGRV